MSDTALIDFLLARIAEDEAVTHESGDGSWRVECPYETGAFSDEDRAAHLAEPFHEGECVIIVGSDGLRIYDEGGHTAADAVHIARHDPARVLAECAAKRRIVEAAQNIIEPDPARRAPLEFVCQMLARPFADHRDYRQEWKP